jgi:hypothetical protein
MNRENTGRLRIIGQTGAIGRIILLLYMTRGFREPLTMKIEEETLAEEGTPVPHVKHGAV